MLLTQTKSAWNTAESPEAMPGISQLLGTNAKHQAIVIFLFHAFMGLSPVESKCEYDTDDTNDIESSQSR